MGLYATDHAKIGIFYAMDFPCDEICVFSLFRILLNGIPTKNFQLSRDILQSDALSPFCLSFARRVSLASFVGCLLKVYGIESDYAPGLHL